MRSRMHIATLVLPALLAVAAASPAAAQMGRIDVEVHEAETELYGADACFIWCNGQDFVAKVGFPPFTTWLSSAEITDRDHPSWAPPFTVSEDVSKLQRYHDIRLQLWDEDDSTGDDLFDISPLNHHELWVHFDACTQTWEEIGMPTTHGPGLSYPPFGTFYSNQNHEFDGRVVIDVHTEGRLPFTTNDISVVDVNPVQVAFDPDAVVSGKSTAMRVVIASTYTGPTPGLAPITVTATDGLGTWTETRAVIIPAGLSTFYFFDGMVAGSAPFVPVKVISDIAFLTYSAHVDYNDVAPSGTAPDFIDCYQVNNGVFGKQTPIVRTIAPDPVFVRWDWLDSNNVPSLGATSVMANRDEAYRAVTWPLAQTAPTVSPAVISTFWNPIDLFTWLSEPYRTLNGLSTGAMLGGVDRMVLVVRKGWFQQNNWRSWIWPSGSIGLSLGEFAPHAVIAEEGWYGVSTHELGHTYRLSQHKCSHDSFNVGCRDEYTISAADGAPFLARGLDVTGAIFNTGSGDGGAGCPAPTPGTREVCRRNIMDAQNGSYFNNWTDTFTLNFLTGTFRMGADPEMVNLSGWVHTTNGWDPGQLSILEGSLDFSYHSFGVPDLEDPLQSFPPRPYSGDGPFAVRLSGESGEHTYRFMPPFVTEGDTAPREGAYFSFFVPWDPTTYHVALYGPADVRNTSCEDGSCAEVLLYERYIKPGPPQIMALAAGRDIAPIPGGNAPAPSIGPGHDVVIAWSASDTLPLATGGGATAAASASATATAPGAAAPGTGDLRAVLLLRRAGTAGVPGGPGGSGGPGAGAAPPWLPYTFEDPGPEVRIPYALLADAPGAYEAQLIVSNGLLSTTFTSGTLFSVVQGSDCQADPTPGAPCDDGNACTRDDQCVQDPFAGVVCRGTPFGCDDNDPCTVDSCNPAPACLVPDNGEGTADLPPQGCAYAGLDDMQILNGLPAGSSIDIAATQRDFTCPTSSAVCSFAPPVPGVDCDAAGGTLGGEMACADSTLAMHMTGTGALLGFNRTINLATGLEMHMAPHNPGDPVQSFGTDLFRRYGQITSLDGDPDFDLFRLVAGSDFGLPSPGHTTLTRTATGDWEVDSYIDITYRIDYIGTSTGALAGMSGSTTGTVRFRTGGGECLHTPVVCDDGNACTVDACSPTSGACTFTPAPAAVCSDGSACTMDDRCVQDPTGGISCHGTPVTMSEPAPAMFGLPAALGWPATLDATHWNTYRGTIPGTMLGSRPPGAVYDQACFESADAQGDGPTLTTDASVPEVGTGFYYLVSGEGACGESPIGHASSGAEVPNVSACPTPP